MLGNHLLRVRVWGDYACFTRPEMKVERVSYPLMTPSAARGVLEAIFWEPQMHYLIHQIAVVKRGNWTSFRRNEVTAVISIGNVRSWMAGKKAVTPIEAGGGAKDGTQRNTLALAAVEYVISAEVRLTARAEPGRDSVDKYLQQVRKRVAAGKCFHRPYLGCREFAADFGPCQSPEEVATEQWDEQLGLMLYDVFDPADRGGGRSLTPQALFFDAKVVNGRVDCHPDRVHILRPTGKVAS